MADNDQAELQARTMKAVDAALEPVERIAAQPQPMSTAHLRTVITSFRQAISAVVYGPPEPEPEATAETDAADATSEESPKAEASVFE